jgi:site-specific recombinase
MVGDAPDVLFVPVAPSFEDLAEVHFTVFHNSNFTDADWISSMKQMQCYKGVGLKSLNGKGNDRCLFRELT